MLPGEIRPRSRDFSKGQVTFCGKAFRGRVNTEDPPSRSGYGEAGTGCTETYGADPEIGIKITIGLGKRLLSGIGEGVEGREHHQPCGVGFYQLFEEHGLRFHDGAGQPKDAGSHQ